MYRIRSLLLAAIVNHECIEHDGSECPSNRVRALAFLACSLGIGGERIPDLAHEIREYERRHHEAHAHREGASS